MVEPRPAATVVLLREAASGLELLLLRREQRASFFPNAWVFPGGRVDAGDAQVRPVGAVPRLPPEHAPFAVAAVRECLEEAGVWLGDGQPPAELRAALNGRRAQLSDHPTLQPRLDRLLLWSWWITPSEEPKRFDTRFFLAPLRPEEAERASPDDQEVVSSLWLSPADALARAHVDDLFLAPPTFRTIEELAPFGSFAALIAAAADRPLHAIEPRIERSADGPLSIILPGDPSYPSPTPVRGPTRLCLREGRWQSEG